MVVLIVPAALGTICQVLLSQAAQWQETLKTAVVACVAAVVTEVMHHFQAAVDRLHSRIPQDHFTEDQVAQDWLLYIQALRHNKDLING